MLCYVMMQACSPYLKKDIDILEKVQKCATKMIYGFSKLSYEQRLIKCKITTLEKRRVRGDLIEVVKILNNFDKVDHRNSLHCQAVVELGDIDSS